MENFKKIKTEYGLRAVILSAALSISCGVLLSCSLLLAFKLCGVEFFWVYYPVIGVGVAAASFWAFYFVFRPDEKKLALKLDAEYALNEKVQTMLEYSSDGSVLARLQREQADGLLAPVAKKKLRFEGLLKYVFAPVLAIALLFTAIFVPGKIIGEADEPFEITEYQRAGVNALVADVQSSALEPALKSGISSVLSELADSLDETALQSAMRAKVVAAVTVIDGAVANENTYLKLCLCFVEKQGVESYAYAISDGANAYKSTAYKLSSMDSVNQKYSLVEEGAQDNFLDWLGKFVKGLPDKEEGDLRDDLTVMAEKLSVFSSGLKEALGEFVSANPNKAEDGLYLNALSTADAVGSVAATAQGYTTKESLSAVISSRLTALSGDCAKPLSKQSYNLIMNDYVRSRLAAIFGVTLPDWVTEVKRKQSEGEANEGDEENSNQGGAGGKGEVVFGTDDVVYDPETDSQVSYTVIVERYKNAVLERIAAGAPSGEIAEYLKNYFGKITSSQEGN